MLLLATALNLLILQALSARPLRLGELRRATGLPAQTTLRGHLLNLTSLGVVGKRFGDDGASAVEHELTPLGRALIGVSDELEAWLLRSPDGPISLRGGAAKGVVKAFVDGWASTTLGALAERPQSLTELDRSIPGLSYPALERRLSSMRMAGLVEPGPPARGGTPYAVTPWARRGVVPLAAASRCEQSHMLELAPPLQAADVEAGFMLALPLVELEAAAAGRCLLAVTGGASDGKGRIGVEVTVAEGRVVECVPRLADGISESASGTSACWTEALAENRLDQLQYTGKLPRDLVCGLRSAFGPVAVVQVPA